MTSSHVMCVMYLYSGQLSDGTNYQIVYIIVRTLWKLNGKIQKHIVYGFNKTANTAINLFKNIHKHENWLPRTNLLIGY